LAEAIGQVHGLHVYAESIVATGEAQYFLSGTSDASLLAVISADSGLLDQFEGRAAPATFHGRPGTVKIGPRSGVNAAALRARLSFLRPRPFGLRQSAGTGDRLGLATPGHLRAFRRSLLAPVLAQQSMRENSRTGRTPQAVLDDATWGAFQAGWQDGFGADADHLKTTADIDGCAAAGYTMFTIDPSEHVDNDANTAPLPRLSEKLGGIPWQALETTWEDTRARYGRPIDLGGSRFAAGEEEWLRAAVKYGRVIAHTLEMARHLSRAMNGRPFDLEMSVDESDTVTTVAEHVYIAGELRRLGVSCTSLAPRYVGEFEKGVDYIGDLAAFERSLTEHLAVANALGPYKLSLHSGSDKFSIFPIAARVAGQLVHLKTAGTSYLEALRAASRTDPELFRAIAVLARDRYATDRASYQVSASIDRMPDPVAAPADRLPVFLDDFHARQILHVTFGSVIRDRPLKDGLLATLRAHAETYYGVLERHFARHFAPFETISIVA